MTNQLKLWQGEFGDDYTTRNLITDEQLQARKQMWAGILNHLFTYSGVESILEIGAGVGINIQAIDEVCSVLEKKPKLWAIEANEKAKYILADQNLAYVFESVDLEDIKSNYFDLAFTSGVLIHIHPDDLLKTMTGIYRASNKYVLCCEYFSPECKEIKYRGQEAALWSNDFGKLYLENFPLQCIGYGFLWKSMTKLDNLTWHLFRKVN